MKNYDVIVVGAGPGGLFTALECAKNGQRVAVIEKNNRCGRKLLVSGAGKCNITQAGEMQDFFDCYGKNAKFLKHSLLNFTNEDLLAFFKKRGVTFVTTEKGKVFPESMKAQTILDVLLSTCQHRGVEIFTNQTVTTVQKEKQFILQTENERYQCETLVIATGGATYQQLGTTGDGYTFAKQLGHKITPTKPALTPLKIKDYVLVDLSGTSFEDLSYTLWRENKKIGMYKGDTLLTHSGVSGPGIINHSRDMQKGDVLKLNFVNADNIDEFKSSFTKKLNVDGKMLVKTVVRDLNLTKRFSDKLLELCEIEETLKCAELTKVKRQRLLTTLTEYEMQIKELGAQHVAMVTTGGVSIKELKPKTMESKKVPNLYFVGEVVDVDGDTGGYNIQAAFSMGYVCASDINAKKEG